MNRLGDLMNKSKEDRFGATICREGGCFGGRMSADWSKGCGRSKGGGEEQGIGRRERVVCSIAIGGRRAGD